MASTVLLLIHFVDFYRIDMDLAAEFCGKALVVLSIVYWLAALNQYLPYATQIFEWLNQNSSGSFSERDFVEGAATMTFSLGTAPFLFVPWCIVTVRLIRKRRFIDLFWLFFYGLGICLSGQRGLLVISLAFLFVSFVYLTKIRVRILLSIILIVIIALSLPVLMAKTSIFSSDEISNAVKIGHFNSFWAQLDFERGLFGNGLATYYYSSGRGAFVAHTELTPIDFARYLGIPMDIVFYCLLLFPTKFISNYRGDKGLFSFGFFLFLVMSLTNPTLVNSYGMLCVLWYWAKIKGTSQSPNETKTLKAFELVETIQTRA